MTGPSTTPSAPTGDAGTPTTTTQSNTPDRKAFGHGSKTTDVAHEIGAYAGEDKARAARAGSRARTIPSRNPNEPATISGETIPEMRARVKREREAAEPTAFQAALIGRRPADASPSLASLGVTSGATGTGATGTGASPIATSGNMAPAPTTATPTPLAPAAR